tara:strand:+ start:966 stop:1814 length:849 start_codon:yes stop_codon:yes gene_type:complete
LPSVLEQEESRAINTSGGRGFGSRVFHCIGYPDVKDVFELLGTATAEGLLIPNIGFQHPTLPGLMAVDFSIEPVGGSYSNQTGQVGYIWKMTWMYEVVTAGAGSSGGQSGLQPNQLGYVEITSRIRAEFVPAWRKGIPESSFPGNGQPNTDTDEVGGTPIDRAGTPISVQRNIQDLTITETVNTAEWRVYRKYRFTRNSSSFLGAPAGKVLYKGASVNRTGIDIYQVSHNFVEDEDFHLQQTPYVDQEGQPIDKDNDEHADFVYWIQPFGTLRDFNAISPNF